MCNDDEDAVPVEAPNGVALICLEAEKADPGFHINAKEQKEL
jgi:hypothetical protein